MTKCQWIDHDQNPKLARVHYCGATTLEGKSYCHNHYWRVYQRGTALAGKRKEQLIDNEIQKLKFIEELELLSRSEHERY